jgi:hypothetical protein
MINEKKIQISLILKLTPINFEYHPKLILHNYDLVHK